MLRGLSLDRPEVSVILPTYNRCEVLGWAIGSVLKQTFGDFELIVVDDGSTDGTAGVVEYFEDKRIRYIRCEKNSGTCAVPRNIGLRVARGVYIAQMDDDVEWFPTKIEKQVEAFRDDEGVLDSNVGGVFCQMWWGGEKIDYLPFRAENIHEMYLRGHYILPHPSVMVRKECYGFYDETLKTGYDWDMWFRISENYRFKFLVEPMGKIYCGESHYSALDGTRARLVILERYQEEFRNIDKDLLARSYFDCGHILLRWGLFSEGVKALKKAFGISPKCFRGIFPIYGRSLKSRFKWK